MGIPDAPIASALSGGYTSEDDLSLAPVTPPAETTDFGVVDEQKDSPGKMSAGSIRSSTMPHRPNTEGLADYNRERMARVSILHSPPNGLDAAPHNCKRLEIFRLLMDGDLIQLGRRSGKTPGSKSLLFWKRRGYHALHFNDGEHHRVDCWGLRTPIQLESCSFSERRAHLHGRLSDSIAHPRMTLVELIGRIAWKAPRR